MEKIFVTRPALPEFEEYAEEIKSIWDTKHITNFGPKYEKFKSAIKEKYHYKNVDLQCNGHMMLQNILSCIEPGEIITTSFTFVSTTLAILNSGHKPVFCDISKKDYNIDVDKIEELITPDTVAIVPVHVYGSPCDVEKIQEIADRHNLKVVYDAAHAFGVKVKGKDIGNFGEASMFSLHGTKVFNSIEGGMAVFQSEDMMQEVISRSNFGLDQGVCAYNGVNSKMNEFTASMGIVNLKHIDENICKRKAIVDIYDSELKEISSLILMDRKDDVEYNYGYYPILVEHDKLSADGLVEYLEQFDIYPRRYFYPAINDMPLFKGYNETPIAKEVAQNILCLPLYADLTKEQALVVCNRIKEYFQNGK